MDQRTPEHTQQTDHVVSSYETPTVVDYGDLAELTAGTSTGNFLDAAFPGNTPRGELTFS